MSDTLFLVKAYYYVGAFEKVYTESQDIETLTESQKIERDCMILKSYVAQKNYKKTLELITDESPTALQAIKLLVQYEKDESTRPDIMDVVNEYAEDKSLQSNSQLIVTLAQIYFKQNQLVEALKLLKGDLTLEMIALSIQILIKMDRPDEAEKKLKVMVKLDEDAIITQLTTAYVYLAQTDNKQVEADLILKELGERYTWTPLLLNLAALCSMKNGKFNEAEKKLNVAYKVDPTNDDTLNNLVVCCAHQGKATDQYLGALLNQHQDSFLSKKLKSFDDQYEQAIAQAS